jgi:hypothetical protein
LLACAPSDAAHASPRVCARGRARTRSRWPRGVGVAQTLANLGFPVRNLEFSGKLVVRGCIVDKVSCAARVLTPTRRAWTPTPGTQLCNNAMRMQCKCNADAMRMRWECNANARRLRWE